MPDLHDISQLPAELRALFSVSSEIQLKRFHEPEPGLFLAESPSMEASFSPRASRHDESSLRHLR